MIYDAVIIGSGPAGITAAIYLARAGHKAIIVERGAPGGKVFLTHQVDNYPGIETITGRELAKQMVEHAKANGVEVAYGEVQKISVDGENKKVISNMAEYETRNVIIATGCENKNLGVKGEVEFGGKGVSYCAVCDGAFFKNKDVVVIGGGNSAIEEGAYLAEICNSVTVVHRSQHFRADNIGVEKLKSLPNVKFKLDCELKEIVGEDKVNSILINNKATGESETISTDGVFIYIGLIAQTSYFADLDITDENGNIIVNEHMETKVKGIYAAGDVIQKDLRQIVTATSDGSIAAQAIINSK